MGLYDNRGNNSTQGSTQYMKLGKDTIKVQGLSSYELAVQQGYTGTLDEWLLYISWQGGSWVGTQAEYNALGTYDSNIIYFIVV